MAAKHDHFQIYVAYMVAACLERYHSADRISAGHPYWFSFFQQLEQGAFPGNIPHIKDPK